MIFDPSFWGRIESAHKHKHKILTEDFLELLLVELVEVNLLMGLRKIALLGELLVSIGEALELCLAPAGTAGVAPHRAREFNNSCVRQR